MGLTNTYSYGLPFSERLAYPNLIDQIKRIKSRMPSIIIVDGALGTGKTTLAVHLADFINKQYGLPPIKLDLKDHEQIAMGGEDFQTQIRKCKTNNLPVIIYDEAGDFKKTYTMSRFNRALGSTMDKIRTFNLIVIVVLPLFYRLDNIFFDNLSARLLIHCTRKMGHNSASFRIYDVDSMAYLKYVIERYYKNFPHKAYTRLTPNMEGHFKDLEDGRSKKLNLLCNRLKDRDSLKAEIKNRGLMGYRELAIKCNRTTTWVRVKVSELKIKPTTMISRAKYFDELALNRLLDEVK